MAKKSSPFHQDMPRRLLWSRGSSVDLSIENVPPGTCNLIACLNDDELALLSQLVLLPLECANSESIWDLEAIKVLYWKLFSGWK